jgi:hypothetical protein
LNKKRSWNPAWQASGQEVQDDTGWSKSHNITQKPSSEISGDGFWIYTKFTVLLTHPKPPYGDFSPLSRERLGKQSEPRVSPKTEIWHSIFPKYSWIPPKPIIFCHPELPDWQYLSETVPF